MKIKVMFIVLCLILVVSLAACTAPASTPTASPASTPQPSQPAAKVFKFKMQPHLQQPINGGSIPLFVKRLESASNGRIKVEVFSPGALAPGQDTHKNLGAGIYELGYVTPNYAAGDIPGVAMIVWGLPFTLEGKAELDYFNWKLGGDEAWRQAVAKFNVYSLGLHPVMQWPAFLSKKPVKTLEDVRGMKIRAYFPIDSWLLAHGASDVTLPWGEVYTALQTGVIDAVPTDITLADDSKLYEVAKYYLDPEWKQNAHYVGMNMDAWKSLPDDLKSVVEVSYREFAEFEWMMYARWEDEARKKWKTMGINMSSFPESDVKEMKALAREDFKKITALSPAAADLGKKLEDYMKWLGRWQ